MKTDEHIIVKIPLSKIIKRTIRKGRNTHLNIYKKKQRETLKKKLLESAGLKVIHEIEKQMFEPSMDTGMYPLTPVSSKCIEEMSLYLHLLVQDFNHLLNIENVYKEQKDLQLKILTKQRSDGIRNNLTTTTKELGLKFLKPFTQIYETHSKNPKNLMIIFVEVTLSELNRTQNNIRPSESQVEKRKKLISEMFELNNIKDYNNFFKLKYFEELFYKAYSLSLAKSLESPIHNVPVQPLSTQKLVYLEPDSPISNPSTSSALE